MKQSYNMKDKFAKFKYNFGWSDDLLTCNSQVFGRPLVVFDTESFRNFSLAVTIGPRGVRAARSDKQPFAAALRSLFSDENVFYVGFNNFSYDNNWINAAQDSVEDNYRLTQRLIVSEETTKKAYRLFDRVQTIDLIDLRGPAEKVGLKGLAARSDATIVQELPYAPEAELTEEQRDFVTAYCIEDCVNTHRFLRAKLGEVELRAGLWSKYLEGKAKSSTLGKFLSSKGAAISRTIMTTLLNFEGKITETMFDIKRADGKELIPNGLTFKNKQLQEHYNNILNGEIDL